MFIGFRNRGFYDFSVFAPKWKNKLMMLSICDTPLPPILSFSIFVFLVIFFGPVYAQSKSITSFFLSSLFTFFTINVILASF